MILVGSQPRLVPPGPLPAPRRRQGGAPGDARRGDRPAPHRDLRARRPAPAAPRRQRRRAVQLAPRRDRGARRARRRLRRRPRRRPARGAATPRAPGTAAAPPPPAASTPPTSTPSSASGSRTERTVTVFSQGVNQSASRHRQGQRDPQLPPRHRPHRPARHGPLLGHRPAERHGRARGRRARQHARRASRPREPRPPRGRAALLARPDHRRPPGPQGGRHVPRRRATAGSRRCGSWRPTPPPACPRPTPCAPRWPPARSSSSPTDRATPTPRATPTCCCPRPAGARRTAPSPIPSAASRRQRAFLPRAGRGAARLVGAGRGRHGALGWPRGLRLRRPGRDLPRARRALRLAPPRSAATSTSAPSPASTTPPTRRWPRCSGRSAAPTASSPTAASSRPDRRARMLPIAAPAARRRRRARASTPAASATSGTR